MPGARLVSCGQRLRELGWLSLEKRRCRGDLITPWKEVVVRQRSASAPSNSDGMRGSGLELHRGRFRLDIRNNFSSKRAVMHWHSCTGGGGVTVHGGAEEPRGCGTEGRGQWARWGGLRLDLRALFQP